jgi:signal transduction histidine kinase
LKKDNFAHVLSSVKNKSIDLTLSTAETEDRRKYGLFSKSYASFPLVIVTKNNISYVNSTNELINKVIAVGKNYTAHELLKKDYPSIKFLEVENVADALKAVSNGDAYAMVDILPVVSYNIRRLNLSNLKISGKTEYQFDVKAFVRDDYPELISIINKGIDSLDENTKNEIFSRWLAVEYVKEVDYSILIKVILGFTLLIIIIVYYKNIKLKQTNMRLVSTLEDLNDTREDLISSEKMATLGELVGSVTHEMSSPLGVCTLGNSYLVTLTNEIDELYKNSNMSEDEFKEYIVNVKGITKNIDINLERTKSLVNSFKEVAVDQVTEEKREFNVKQYLDDILFPLKSKLLSKNVVVDIDCDKKLYINNYPGYIAQVLFNFINNSIMHAFEDVDNGKIGISVKLVNDNIVSIYSDNGKGINKNMQDKLFDQYFTTKKNNGGTGLGLYIVKSIVENKLSGKLDFESEIDKGVKITITIPS